MGELVDDDVDESSVAGEQRCEQPGQSLSLSYPYEIIERTWRQER